MVSFFCLSPIFECSNPVVNLFFATFSGSRFVWKVSVRLWANVSLINFFFHRTKSQSKPREKAKKSKTEAVKWLKYLLCIFNYFEWVSRCVNIFTFDVVTAYFSFSQALFYFISPFSLQLGRIFSFIQRNRERERERELERNAASDYVCLLILPRSN